MRELAAAAPAGWVVDLRVTVAWFAEHRRIVHRGPLPPDDPGGTDPLPAAVNSIRPAGR